MPVTCDMQLTGSNVPGPCGARTFTFTPAWRCAPGMPVVAALPKPWVMATTPVRRRGSNRTPASMAP